MYGRLLFRLGWVAGILGSGCGYFAPPDKIKTQRQVANQLVVEDSVHVAAATKNDTASIRFSDQKLALAGFTEHFHPIVKNYCGGCHGANISPGFAVDDSVSAFSTVMAAGLINYSNPEKSRIVKRLTDQSHNCWNDCAADGASMVEAIGLWLEGLEVVDSSKDPSIKFQTMPIALVDQVSPRIEPAEGDEIETMEEQSQNFIYLEAEDGRITRPFMVGSDDQAFAGSFVSADQNGPLVLPANIADEELEELGKLTLDFEVTENGRYQFYARVASSGQESDSFFIQVGDDELAIWDVLVENDGYQWVRMTQRRDRNRAGNLNPNLQMGQNRIHFYQRGRAVRLDAVVLSAGELDVENLVPSSTVSTLQYDLSSSFPDLGEGVVFSVQIEDFNDKSYLLRNPSLTIGDNDIRIANIKPMINGFYSDQHATFTVVDQTVSETRETLSFSPLIMLKEKGLSEDQLSFGFEILEKAVSGSISTQDQNDN